MIKQTFHVVFSIKAGKSFKQTKKKTNKQKKQANSGNLLCENNKITKTLYNNLIKSLQ